MRLPAAAEAEEVPASSGRSSSARPHRSSASRRSSSSRASSARPSRRSATAPATSTTAARDLRRRPSRRHRRGQRRHLSGVALSGVPWVRIASCNPAEIKDHDVPPVFSGYPVGDRSAWDAFWAAYGRAPRADARPSSASTASSAARRRCRRTSSSTRAPVLNLYLYPEEVDYPRAPRSARTGTTYRPPSAPPTTRLAAARASSPPMSGRSR